MADLRVQRQSMGKRLAALPCYDTSNARAQVQNQSHANSFITMPRGSIWYLELTFSQQLRVEKKSPIFILTPNCVLHMLLLVNT